MRDLHQELLDAIDAKNLDLVLEITELLELAEHDEREQAKRQLARILLDLGCTPHSFVSQRRFQ